MYMMLEIIYENLLFGIERVVVKSTDLYKYKSKEDYINKTQLYSCNKILAVNVLEPTLKGW